VFTTVRSYVVAILFVVVVAPWLPTGFARAQSTTRSQRLSALQQQNAVQQQRNSVQTAALQTTLLLQANYQQNTVTTNSINFQLQQNALQDALQQTSGLQKSGAASSAAAGQLNTLQNALQQSSALQTALQQQSGVLSATQLQTLSQVQSSLMGLLLSRPQPLTSKKSRP
jgi:hypothetical protein